MGNIFSSSRNESLPLPSDDEVKKLLPPPPSHDEKEKLLPPPPPPLLLPTLPHICAPPRPVRRDLYQAVVRYLEFDVEHDDVEMGQWWMVVLGSPSEMEYPGQMKRTHKSIIQFVGEISVRRNDPFNQNNHNKDTFKTFIEIAQEKVESSKNNEADWATHYGHFLITHIDKEVIIREEEIRYHGFLESYERNDEQYSVNLKVEGLPKSFIISKYSHVTEICEDATSH